MLLIFAFERHTLCQRHDAADYVSLMLLPYD